MIDVARGDAATNRMLRETLGFLRDQSEDEEFRRMVDDVLAGRAGLRDAITSPVFARVLDPLVRQGVEQYEAIPEEEKQRLVAEAEARLQRDQPE